VDSKWGKGYENKRGTIRDVAGEREVKKKKWEW
jgi:hypothetical protein